MDVPPVESPAPAARANARRVVAFLAALAVVAAAGWQAGRILEPPLPLPTTGHEHLEVGS